MSLRIAQIKKTSLRTPLAAADTSVKVRALVDIDGNTVAFSDFGDEMVVIVVKQGDVTEIIKCSGITQNANGTANLTVASNGRSIAPTYPFAGAATGEDFQTGEVIVTNDVLTMSRYACLDNANTWDDVQTFTVAPASSADATTANQLIRKSQLDAAVLGVLAVTPLITPGTAGETLAIDQLVYLKTTDQRWWLCDADTAATVDNVLLGITRGAGATGAAITSGVHLLGRHTAASAVFTAGAVFASNTAGAFATAAGTVEVSLGTAISTTAIEFSPRYNQQLTEDQQDALAGSSGTPSATNKLVTQADPLIPIYLATVVGTDAYAATPSPAPALTNGLTIHLKLDVANTGPATFNYAAGGALAIVKGVSTALVTGDMLANQIVTLRYNSTGTVWQLVDTPTNLVTGATINDQHHHSRKVIFATRATDAASGSVTYAHGLGVAPKWYKIHMLYTAAASDYWGESVGMWDGTNQGVIYKTNTGASSVTDTSNVVWGKITGDDQKGAHSAVDATNITIAWTKVGTPASYSMQLMIECGV